MMTFRPFQMIVTFGLCLASLGTSQAQEAEGPRGNREDVQQPLQLRRFQGRRLDAEQMERMNEAMRQLQSIQRRYPGQFREMPLDRLAELYQEAGPERFIQGFRFDSPAMAKLGLILRPVPEVLRSHLDLPESGGMVVDVVAENSPSTGVIEPNDILLKIGETDIQEVADIEKALETLEGNSISVTLMRRGEKQSVTIEIERDKGQELAEPKAEEAFRLGIAINEPDEAIRAQLGLEEGQGVIVMEVAPESAAEKAGIKANDVLISLDGEPIAGITELAELVQRSGGKPISLELLRDGKEMTIEATPEKVVVPPTPPGGPRGPRAPSGMRFFGPGVMIDPETGAIRPGPVPGRPRLPNQPRELMEAPIPPKLERQLEELTQQLEQLRKEVERLQEDRPERPGRRGREGV